MRMENDFLLLRRIVMPSSSGSDNQNITLAFQEMSDNIYPTTQLNLLKPSGFFPYHQV